MILLDSKMIIFRLLSILFSLRAYCQILFVIVSVVFDLKPDAVMDFHSRHPEKVSDFPNMCNYKGLDCKFYDTFIQGWKKIFWRKMETLLAFSMTWNLSCIMESKVALKWFIWLLGKMWFHWCSFFL